MEFLINVAKDFSAFPSGRLEADGPASGQLFRVKHLVPALQNNRQVRIELDDTVGYPSSWLDEVFGGLIRNHGFTQAQVFRRLELVTKDFALLEEICGYVNTPDWPTPTEPQREYLKTSWKARLAELQASDSVIKSVSSRLSEIMFEQLLQDLPSFLEPNELDLTVDTDDGVIVLEIGHKSTSYLLYRSLATGSLHVCWIRNALSGTVKYAWDNSGHKWPQQLVTAIKRDEPIYLLVTAIREQARPATVEPYVAPGSSLNPLLEYTCIYLKER
jgi:frataxin-like iron-binding protein CyaY